MLGSAPPLYCSAAQTPSWKHRKSSERVQTEPQTGTDSVLLTSDTQLRPQLGSDTFGHLHRNTEDEALVDERHDV